ncbi:MAG TPA: GGDEF domain-containing protein [Burkholderiaceae bacterium]|jgi:diguanylate cyclase (GGDEF)-like protein
MSASLGRWLLRFGRDEKSPHAAVEITRDPLTGVLDRKHFIRAMKREWSRARRHQMACAVVLVDLDHFRRVNACYGRRCGDAALRRIAKLCGEGLRQSDVLARFGGEEFILFLPHTDPLGAVDVAERLRSRVAALDFNWRNHDVSLSVSVGVASMRLDHRDLDQLIHETEEALGTAKSAGRNCVRANAGLLPGRPSRAVER